MLKFGLQNLKFRWLTFNFYSLVSTLSVPSRLLRDDSSLSFLLKTLMIGLIVTLITLPMLWAVCYLNQHYQLGIRNYFYPLGLIAAVGALRGEVIQLVISGSGLKDNLTSIYAVFSSMIFTTIYFLVIASFMEKLFQRKDDFNRLFNEASLLLINPISSKTENSDLRYVYDSTLAGIKGHLSSFNLKENSADASKLRIVSREIQLQINDVLRPLSHRLWVNGLGEVKHRNLFGILRDSIENLDFGVRNIFAYQFFVGGYGIALVLGVKSSIYVTTIGILTSLALIYTYFFIRQKLSNFKFELGIVFLILMALLPVIMPLAIRNPLNETANALAGLLISPTLPCLILLISSYRLLARDRDFAIGAASTVRNKIESISMTSSNLGEGIHLAEYFHNSLQSELYGISKRLEMISNSPSEVNGAHVIQSLEDALTRNYEEISASKIDGIFRINRLVDSWKGIADITSSGLDLIEKNSILSNRASQFIEEMITNTIRYGDADKIHFELTSDTQVLNILLTHNGKKGFIKKSGLGTLLMKHYSESGLGVEPEIDENRLRISIPIK